MKFKVSRTSYEKIQSKSINLIEEPRKDEYDSYRYICDISYISELINFVSEVGRVIIHEDLTIEVYDDYRE